jgi:single-strand DNA-binding protein
MLNQCQFIGNLGADPECKTFQSGDRIANLRLAVTERWKDKQSGERKERTEWVSVVLRAGLVEVAEKYLRKGSKVFVSGRLSTRKWQDRDGNDRYATEIMGDKLVMLDSAPSGGRPQDSGWGDSKPQGQQGGGNAGGWADDLDDDVPFATPYPVRKRGVI